MPKYLLDANFFISAHRAHYPFDVVPSFWLRLEELANKGLIGSIDKVGVEIKKGNDVLKDWITDKLSPDFFTDSSVFINEYIQLAQWANGMSHHYSLAALAEFLDADEADAWLIAAGMNTGATVTTHELSNPAMKSRIAMPEPCNHFSVTFCNTLQMFRELGVTF